MKSTQKRMGRDKVGAKVLRELWAECLRKRGHIVPTRVPALRALRPPGGYSVVPSMVLGGDQQLAIDVCVAIETLTASLSARRCKVN